MGNYTKLQKIMATSPHFEMLIRRVYWNENFKKYRKIFNKKKKNERKKDITNIDLDIIKTYLLELGVKKGDILIIHSSYAPFREANILPNTIIQTLLDVVGPTGTIAMPVIRIYPKKHLDESGSEYDLYNVQKSKVWTGRLPSTLMRMQGAVTSQFPINTLTAIGKEAAAMMQHNLAGDSPKPNGENSSWKYCLDKNAWCIGLGIDLTHSLTMIHTAEDNMKDGWVIQNWYKKRRFKIIDKQEEFVKTVLEKDINWGCLHFAERTLAKDLIKNKILNSNIVEGILIETLKSKELLNFLNSKNKRGYPYFWVSNYLTDNE